MKIRLGFVSNSSSSSYIVKIAMPEEAFYQWFASENWFGKFSREGTLKDMDDKLTRFRATLAERVAQDAEQDEKLKWFSSHTIDMYTRMIKEIEELRDKLPKTERPEPQTPLYPDASTWVPIVLDYHKLRHSTTASGMLKLECGTSMHNSYEDVPELLRNIIVAFSFEGGCLMDCHRDEG